MTTASLDNCKRLFELSGWKFDKPTYCSESGDLSELKTICAHDRIPAYDLGFLLRKLPQSIDIEGHKFGLSLNVSGLGYVKWGVGYEYIFTDGVSSEHFQLADTPEDAAALLCIKLFEEGVIS